MTKRLRRNTVLFLIASAISAAIAVKYTSQRVPHSPSQRETPEHVTTVEPLPSDLDEAIAVLADTPPVIVEREGSADTWCPP